MTLTYSPKHKLFVWKDTDAQLARKYNFDYSPAAGKYYTGSPYIAALLHKHADDAARSQLKPILENLAASSAKHPTVGGYDDRMFDYQQAGVENLIDQYRKRKSLMLADQPGLGKSCQSLITAKHLGAKRLLVICPGSLRYNWQNECRMWYPELKTQPVFDGKTAIDAKATTIISYGLLNRVLNERYDMMVVDECHYIKSIAAMRTKLILGELNKGWRGLIANCEYKLFMSGTPLPNGKPNEVWPILFRTAPDVISNLKYMPFVRTYCEMFEDGFGGIVVKGAKRQDELYMRLRGSGFMTRRLKKDVLTQLPAKLYKLITFPPDKKTKEILEQEAQFSVNQILEKGVPAGSALPEIRRQMGIAKVDVCVDYIDELLTGGVDKAVIFAHHIDVVAGLAAGLGQYHPKIITGQTKPADRQARVDAFQTDPDVRLIIGNSAMKEGLNLTAASDVVLVEPSWVPGDNDQMVDRLHRIGQKYQVVVHNLVVQGSLDAKILASSADKAVNNKRIVGE